MKLVNILKAAAWGIVIISLLAIVWILSGIYHRPKGEGDPVPLLSASL